MERDLRPLQRINFSGRLPSPQCCLTLLCRVLSWRNICRDAAPKRGLCCPPPACGVVPAREPGVLPRSCWLLVTYRERSCVHERFCRPYHALPAPVRLHHHVPHHLAATVHRPCHLLVVTESLWLKTKNPVYYHHSRLWSKLFVLNFVVEVASGIPLEFQFGANWSAFSTATNGFFGNLLGFEGAMAFMLEAGFLGIMIFGWNRVSPRMQRVPGKGRGGPL